MAEQELSEDNKRQLEAGREAKAKSMEEFAKRTQGKPTPTQEENDEAALGKHFMEHEADGGEPDLSGQVEKTLESGRTGSYQTRQTTAARPAPASTAAHRTPGSSSS